MEFEIINKLGEQFEVNVNTALQIAAFLAIVIAFAKEHLGLKRTPILIVAGVIAVILNAYVYSPAWPVDKIMLASSISFMASVGGWALVKQAAHKVGRPSSKESKTE